MNVSNELKSLLLTGLENKGHLRKAGGYSGQNVSTYHNKNERTIVKKITTKIIHIKLHLKMSDNKR